MEKKGTTSQVLELPVESLAGNFFGFFIRLLFLRTVRTPITPPGKLAASLRLSLLNDCANPVRKTLAG